MAARWEKPCVCFGRGRGRKTFTVRGYLWFPSSILYRVTQNDAACLDTSAHRLFCQVLISSLLSSKNLTNAVSNMGNSSGSQCKAVLYHQWERAGALLSPAALRPTLILPALPSWLHTTIPLSAHPVHIPAHKLNVVTVLSASPLGTQISSNVLWQKFPIVAQPSISEEYLCR